MTPPPLPRLPDALDLRDWDAIAAQFQAILDRPLSTAEVPAWLADCSTWSERLQEAMSLVSIEYSRDTTDPARKEAYMHMVREVMPKARAIEQVFKERLLATGWEGPGMEEALRQFRAEAALFRAENLPLMAETQALGARYDEIIGGLTVQFDGAERTLSQLRPYRESPDEDVRRGSWQLAMGRYLEVRSDLDGLFDQLLGLRRQIAANAGYANFRDYSWQRMGRFDYSPEEAETFHEAIHDTVVPALARRAARRATLLGQDQLRPWDVDVDPYSAMPLKPFGDGAALASGSERILQQVRPILGQRVAEMASGGLLDLDNRKGKAPGGYCSTLPQRGLPFIFMNAVGTDDDLRTMLHEAGHAFHVFETRDLPLAWQRHAPMEFCEVASMAMELLAAPYIERAAGGFYEPAEARRSRIGHLERMLFFLPYMATVSAFQHWIYANPDHDHAARDAQWLRLHQANCVGEDWSGHEDSRASLWHQKLHIFRAPFYYIEYGIAQLGALQVWRNSRKDPEAALQQYLGALALGGTKGLRDLYRAAGVELALTAETIAPLVAMIEDEISRLEAEI
ncbi:MAG TPA: M3 family oligoendopeptidase [Anaerolineae bacterium]|nr:M3 family oligoendopeptidase [Anaerolineae bacterium]